MNVEQVIQQAEARCAQAFRRAEAVSLRNTERVLQALQDEGVAVRHFAPTNGYGYDDTGRDTLERVFARVFRTEAALVRPQIVSGTHALSLCLFGLLLPGDELLSVSGEPYDTLHGIIGIHDCPTGSLREMGVSYRQVELTQEGRLDLPAIRAALNERTKVVAVQRSRGYATRRSLLPEEIVPLAELVHQACPQAALMVDNCYGEFVRDQEPSDFGADVCVGSLIKNAGGGLAPTGGYVVGREALVDRIAYRLTAPGIGREVGSYMGGYQPFYQGLFLAPHTVSQAVKTATLAAAIFEAMGMRAEPTVDGERTDIIEAIELGTPERVIAFCQGVQTASPIDSQALPEPWDMPGYAHPIIMAAGTFVSGASIELSADAPMRPPYAVYMQGGLTYEHGRIAMARVLRRMEGSL